MKALSKNKILSPRNHYFKTRNIKTTQGFTLIELLVVIAIIALLSSVVMAALATSRTKARDSARLSNARQLSIALEQYELSTNSYKVSGSGYNNTGSGLASKTGTAEYTTSITSKLKSLGFYSGDRLLDPQYGTDNYYIGVCESGTSTKYNIFLKVEQKNIQHNESLVKTGCDGTTAFTLGFNHLFGAVGGGGGSQIFGTPTTAPPSYTVYSGNGIYLAARAGGKYVYSTDNKNWYESPVTDSSGTIHDIGISGTAYGPNGFILYGREASDGKNLAISSDGKTWNFIPTNSGVSWQDAGYYLGNYVVLGDSGGDGKNRVMLSSDGTNWKSPFTAEDTDINGNIYWYGSGQSNGKIIFQGSRDENGTGTTIFNVECDPSGNCTHTSQFNPVE